MIFNYYLVLKKKKPAISHKASQTDEGHSVVVGQYSVKFIWQETGMKEEMKIGRFPK